MDRALLAKIGQIQLRTHAGNAADAPVAVQTTTAAEIAAASTIAYRRVLFQKVPTGRNQQRRQDQGNQKYHNLPRF